MRTVCVFCGSREGTRPSYAEAARIVGKTLAGRGIGVIYGGGRVGLMGAVADAVIEEGGEVVGVIPEALLAREIAHEGLTKLHVVGSIHERKRLMAGLSDGFVALPGGYGTFEEFLEVLSWAQLGIHRKPCGLLDVDGYYEPLATLFDEAVKEGFVPPHHRPLVLMKRDPESLLDAMVRYTPPETNTWVGPRDP